MKTVIPLPPPDPALRLSAAVCWLLIACMVGCFAMSALSTFVTH
jgi:hypothetical protein